MKPIKTYAQTCCKRAFYENRGAKQFKRQMAVEHITYALEVLKFLWNDGLERVEIGAYSFVGDNLQITLKNHSGSTKTGSKPLPDGSI